MCHGAEEQAYTPPTFSASPTPEGSSQEQLQKRRVGESSAATAKPECMISTYPLEQRPHDDWPDFSRGVPARSCFTAGFSAAGYGKSAVRQPHADLLERVKRLGVPSIPTRETNLQNNERVADFNPLVLRSDKDVGSGSLPSLSGNDSVEALNSENVSRIFDSDDDFDRHHHMDELERNLQLQSGLERAASDCVRQIPEQSSIGQANQEAGSDLWSRISAHPATSYSPLEEPGVPVSHLIIYVLYVH